VTVGHPAFFYELRVIAPVASSHELWGNQPELARKVMHNLPAMLRSVEEDLGDLFPEGWTVRIEEME
jgi:hypothetical protein